MRISEPFSIKFKKKFDILLRSFDLAWTSTSVGVSVNGLGEIEWSRPWLNAVFAVTLGDSIKDKSAGIFSISKFVYDDIFSIFMIEILRTILSSLILLGFRGQSRCVTLWWVSLPHLQFFLWMVEMFIGERLIGGSLICWECPETIGSGLKLVTEGFCGAWGLRGL